MATADDRTAGIEPIVVMVDGPELLLSCWPARPLLKSLPGARWDRGRRAWIVPAALLPEVESRLETWPGGVIIARDSPEPPRHAPGESWAEQMFAAVPHRLHKRVYRSLAATLHPDRNGDHAAMAALSAARDKAVTS